MGVGDAFRELRSVSLGIVFWMFLFRFAEDDVQGLRYVSTEHYLVRGEAGGLADGCPQGE